MSGRYGGNAAAFEVETPSHKYKKFSFLRLARAGD